MPHVTARCLRCKVRQEDVEKNNVIVSPTGMAHFGDEFGETSCGIDATDDGWWWPA